MRSAVATGRAKAREPEDPIQVACVEYLEATLPHGFIVHHCANKPRSAAQGAREKRMGAKAGWPDIEIHGRLETDEVPRLWLAEVKPPHVSVPAHQRDMHDRLRDVGWPPVRIVRSLDDMRRAVWDWGLPSLDVGLRAFATGRAST